VPELETYPPDTDGITSAAPATMLLAVDCAPSSLGAMRTAAALACASGVRLHVLSVVEPRTSGRRGAETDEEAARNRVSGRTRAIHDALVTVCPAMHRWPIEVCTGDPVTLIARGAAAHPADILALGLPPRNRGGVPRDETAIRAIRRSPIPVLAVVPGAGRIPMRAVAGMDFSPASLRAARLACRLLAPGGVLHLVHVQPDFASGAVQGDGMRLVYQQGIAAGFARLRDDLCRGCDVRVEHVILEGDTFAQLLDFAGRVDADLVTLGTHRQEAGTQPGVGRVTTAFLRQGSVSLLIAPPPPATVH
jgi:nucleotide-binding universal stress UspA family protein